MTRTPILLLTVLSLLTGLGCALNTPARHKSEEGFLSDYSILHKGTGHQAERVYFASDADWSKYTKVLLDPVTVWRGTESRSHGLSAAKAQVLADYFYNVIQQEVSKHYQLVSIPGPDTLRVQVALTKVDETHVVLDIVSTIVPQAALADRVQALATGRLAFVGSAQVEARVMDSQTGRILGEGVDRRLGGKRLNAKSLERWGDVENIMKFWADRAVYNLCSAQERSDCGSEPSTRLGTS